ncbi:pyruvate, water dikinase [Desulfonatronum thiosulfatophilum]|uniref:Phosphoenolpyruvate synthase n=1 Tax=Desulfonatronum thiosulfatophilum TaxID=617002 RepID=A0A1G6CLM5_9BACT|nr:PEP/pyruvate-binding domain-containing protein [Desulfonatronum thiosulfatophilum]SDB33685.1 pyruvate, water dikinase [Desulfonatronum thiosulfatophilum]
MAARRKSCRPLADPASDHARSYDLFKEFLAHNSDALEAMAEVDQAYRGGWSLRPVDVHEYLGRLLISVKAMVSSMEALGGDKYAPLRQLVERIGREVLVELQPLAARRKELVLPLRAVTSEMISFTGAKAANLGIMASQLDIPVPAGFVVTAEAFRLFMRENQLQERIREALDGLDPDAAGALEDVSRNLRQTILEAEVPRSLAEEIEDACRDLEKRQGGRLLAAVRSSAVGEDGRISFAGQYVSVLGVDRKNILADYRQVLAGKYSPRAIAYRLHNQLGDDETPMCALIMAMVDARAGGVAYSVNPAGEQREQSGAKDSTESDGADASDPDVVMIFAVPGLGETLVSGVNSPDVYVVDKKELSIVRREIVGKTRRLRLKADGGTELVDVDENLRDKPAISDALIRNLARHVIRLEQYFQAPQDIEWAEDQQGRMLLLQSRPLKVVQSAQFSRAKIDDAAHPVLLSAGKTASVGIAAGKAFIPRDPAEMDRIPENAILVVRNASPDYARYMQRIQGLVTETGGVGSHLASVVREYGVPAIVDAKEAAARIEQGVEVTMDAGTTTIYRGRIQKWVDAAKKMSPGRAMHGPMQHRLENILEKITPLHLLDPQSETFTPENCRTIHDVIRYLHEKSITEMFTLSEDRGAHDRHPAAVLAADIPLRIRLIDLGGGLREGLTDCDVATPDDIRSVPLRALWNGLTHPGLNWSSTVDPSPRNLAALMTSGALGHAQQVVGQDSFALVAEDYLNLNAKFGYHYANLDALCTDEGSRNYVSFQFSGGAGSYFGKSLRVLLLAEILERLEFRTEMKGDFITAVLKGHDALVVQEKLDLMGRLLGCSRLLDVALKDEQDVQRLAGMFFAGDYDFLAHTPDDGIRNFYVREGHWSRHEEEGETICRQTGNRMVDPVSSGLACLLGRVTGDGYHSFLETIKAYSYFPLAIAKDSRFSNGELEVAVRCESGCIDMAAGLAFGLRNAGNYFVFRIDALKNNAVLLVFEQGRHKELDRAVMEFNPDQWYRLGVSIAAQSISASVDGEIVLEHHAPKAIHGYCGLWSKSDSVASFRKLHLRHAQGERTFEC